MNELSQSLIRSLKNHANMLRVYLALGLLALANAAEKPAVVVTGATGGTGLLPYRQLKADARVGEVRAFVYMYQCMLGQGLAGTDGASAAPARVSPGSGQGAGETGLNHRFPTGPQTSAHMLLLLWHAGNRGCRPHVQQHCHVASCMMRAIEFTAWCWETVDPAPEA